MGHQHIERSDQLSSYLRSESASLSGSIWKEKENDALRRFHEFEGTLKPSTARGDDGFTLFEAESPQVMMKIHPNVTESFRMQADDYLHRIPDSVQKAINGRGYSIELCADESQLPAKVRHSPQAHEPVIYDQAGKRIILNERTAGLPTRDATKFERAVWHAFKDTILSLPDDLSSRKSSAPHHK